MVEKQAVPLLKQLGVKAEIGWVDTTDQGSLFQGTDQAALTFRTKKIDRVMFLGGARLASIFGAVAAAQSYTPRLALSSFDNPGFFVNNPDTLPPASLVGSIGHRFQPLAGRPRLRAGLPLGRGRDAVPRDLRRRRDHLRVARGGPHRPCTFCDSARLLKEAGDQVTGPSTPPPGQRPPTRWRTSDRRRLRFLAGGPTPTPPPVPTASCAMTRTAHVSNTRVTMSTSPESPAALTVEGVCARTVRSRSSSTPRCTSRRARWWRSSAPTASASRRCSRSSVA